MYWVKLLRSSGIILTLKLSLILQLTVKTALISHSKPIFVCGAAHLSSFAAVSRAVTEAVGDGLAFEMKVEVVTGARRSFTDHRPDGETERVILFSPPHVRSLSLSQISNDGRIPWTIPERYHGVHFKCISTVPAAGISSHSAQVSVWWNTVGASNAPVRHATSPVHKIHKTYQHCLTSRCDVRLDGVWQLSGFTRSRWIKEQCVLHPERAWVQRAKHRLTK